MKTFSLKSVLFSLRPRKIFVANNMDSEVRYNSSSGGAFYAIAKYVLSQNGVVVGAAYNGTNVEHIEISDLTDLWKLQKSKYAPSSLQKLKMDALLATGKLVLFSGTPCQVKGIAKKYAGTKNLLLLEIACHGLPEKKEYEDYIQKNKIVKIDFRCKKKGWKNNMIELHKSDGTIYYEDALSNVFYQKFISGEIIKKGCFTCKSKYFSSGADFTLADAWGINDFAPQLDDNKGSSIIISHSDRANKIWEIIHKEFLYSKSTLREIIRFNHNIVRPSNSQPLFIEAIDPCISLLTSLSKKNLKILTGKS